MTFLSLFSGIGGFDLGFEQAGIECVGQVEWNADCQRVLKRHWPNVSLLSDVRALRAILEPRNAGRRAALSLSLSLSQPDIVCGGFPCQDVSVAGHRAGLAGSRSGMWFEFRRIIALIRPRWICIENVPGLLSSNYGRDMGTIVRGLEKLGYWWSYRVLDAQWFGIPQRRRRVFIVGSLAGPRTAEVLFESTSMPWDSPPRRSQFQEVAYCVAAGTGGSKFGSGRQGQDTFVCEIASTLTHGAKSGRRKECDWNLVASTLSSNGHDSSEDGTRMRVRRLTPVECERLQGFPDDWTAGHSDSARFRMLGNAVAVPVARWIAERIAAA